MRAGEGEVAWRVPVLGQDNMREAPGQPVDHRHDLVPPRHGERAAGTEIVLHIDDQQHLLLAGRLGRVHGVAPPRPCSDDAGSSHAPGYPAMPSSLAAVAPKILTRSSSERPGTDMMWS